MKKYIPKLVGSYFNILSYVSPDYAANKALHLFSTPRKGRITEKNKIFLDTAKKNTLSYEGLRIMTYNWKGSKDTILLVHGWESNAARWKRKIKRFSNEGFNVVALDGPAHGDSGSREFNALLYSEFINVVVKAFNPRIVIGHSVGGMASVFFQQKYQHPSIKKLILLGSPSEFEDVLLRYVKMLGYNRKVTNRLKTVILNRFGSKTEDFSTSKSIKDIEAEGLIFHDIKDPIIPFSDAKLIEKNFNKGKLITTKGLGHSLNDESISEDILNFIKE